MAKLPHFPHAPHMAAQLRDAADARPSLPSLPLNLGALVPFPLVVLAMFLFPSSGEALVALAALALSFLGGVVYGACLRATRATPAAPASQEARLLATLEADVSRAELPNGAARLALARAIVAGDVDALYTPISAKAHNVCLAGLPADVDPRMTLAQWATCAHATIPQAALVLGAHRAKMGVSEMLAQVLAPDQSATAQGATHAQEGR